jgi:hypothetical protein
MLILKKQLFTIQAAIILLLLASCSTPTYTYYYSVLKQNDNRAETNFRKYGYHYSIYPIYNLLNNTTIDNNAVQYFLEIYEGNATVTVKNEIPIFIDCEKSFLSINQSKYEFSAWLYKPGKYSKKNELFDRTNNILPINPFYSIDLNRKTFYSNDFLKRIPIDSLTYYDIYDNADFDEIRNYTLGDIKGYENTKYKSENYSSLYYKPFTIDLPVIKFTEENTPLKIGIDLVYYTDSTYNDKHEVKAEFYQSELMILKNIRLDVQRKDQNCYYKGEIIGLEVKDISFYTERKTGSIFGLPEMRLGLGKTSFWILSPIRFPIEVVWGIRNAGDGRAVFPYPLFE